MVHLKTHRILQYFLQMLALFHVVLTSIAIITNVGYFLVFATFIVLFSLFKVVHVFEFIVFNNMVGVFLSKLENDVILLW